MLKLRAAWNLRAGADPTAVESAYRAQHVPRLRELEGLRRHNLLRFLRDARGGTPSWWRGEELYFEDVEALTAAAATASWADAWGDAFAADVAGPSTHVFEIEEEFRPAGAPPPSDRGPQAALSGIWHVPAEKVPAEIEPVYHDVHVPGVRQLPRLQCHTVMKAVDWPAGRHARAWRSAEVRFDTVEDFEDVFASEAYDGIRRDGFNLSVVGPEVAIYEIEAEWWATGAGRPAEVAEPAATRTAQNVPAPPRSRPRGR